VQLTPPQNQLTILTGRVILTDTFDLSGEYDVFKYDLEYGLREKLTTDL
jgi:hypothetical protein